MSEYKIDDEWYIDKDSNRYSIGYAIIHVHKDGHKGIVQRLDDKCWDDCGKRAPDRLIFMRNMLGKL